MVWKHYEGMKDVTRTWTTEQSLDSYSSLGGQKRGSCHGIQIFSERDQVSKNHGVYVSYCNHNKMEDFSPKCVISPFYLIEKNTVMENMSCSSEMIKLFCWWWIGHWLPFIEFQVTFSIFAFCLLIKSLHTPHLHESGVWGINTEYKTSVLPKSAVMTLVRKTVSHREILPS